MNGRALGFLMTAAMVALGACAGGGAEGDVALETSGVSVECLGLRAELRSCVDRGWNQAECVAAFRDGRAALGVGEECAPNASCADVRAWYRTCLDDGGGELACQDQFYTDRSENYLESECTPVATCGQLRAELATCLAEGEARPACESAIADEVDGAGATCPIDDL